MRRIALRTMTRARVRGLRRKCGAMIDKIDAIANEIPTEHRKGCGYWHAHLPVAQAFIDSPRTPGSVRRLCVQSIVEAADRLRSRQQARTIQCRVVAAVELPGLFNSQIIVFFGDDYFSSFFQRDTPEQRWTPLEPRRSLAREWTLKVPGGFVERGFEEVIAEEDYQHRGELWFFGDVELHANQRLQPRAASAIMGGRG